MPLAPANTRRVMAIVVAAVAAIPFWALVAQLHSSGPRRAEAPAAPRVAPSILLSPVKCQRLQVERQQSLVDCVYRVGRRHSVFPPGDYPLRPSIHLMAAGADVPTGGI